MIRRTDARVAPTALLTLVIACAVGGTVRAEQRCDPNKPEATPVQRFSIDPTHGYVFDTRTGLTWKRCPERFTYTNGRCAGYVGDGEFTWDRAGKAFANTPDGWRLPSIQELESIVEKRCTNPSVDARLFPDTPAVWFWSSSALLTDGDFAYAVYFGRGLVGVQLKTSRLYVRLVRGQEWLGASDAAKY